MKTQGKVWIIYDAQTKTQTKPMSVVQAQVILLSLSNKESERYFIWTPGWDEWTCVQDFLQSEQKYFAITQPPKPKGDTSNGVDVSAETVTVTQNAPATHYADSIYTQVVVGEAPLREEPVANYDIKDFHGNELDLKNIKKVKAPDSTKKKSDSTASKASTKESERRRDPRHNFKIEVVLVSKVRSFRTYSRNISLSGTMLEDEIPKDFLNRPFDLIITNPFEPDPTKARLLFRAKIVGDLVDARRLMFIEQDVAMTLRLDALLKAYVTYQSQLRKTAG